MEEVTTFRWIINLINYDSLTEGLMKKYHPGCKAEFERAAQSPTNNPYFTKWFGCMVKSGIFKFVGDKEIIGGTSKTYVIIEKELWKELTNHPFYESVRNAFVKKDRFVEL